MILALRVVDGVEGLILNVVARLSDSPEQLLSFSSTRCWGSCFASLLKDIMRKSDRTTRT